MPCKCTRYPITLLRICEEMHGSSFLLIGSIDGRKHIYFKKHVNDKTALICTAPLSGLLITENETNVLEYAYHPEGSYYGGCPFKINGLHQFLIPKNKMKYFEKFLIQKEG